METKYTVIYIESWLSGSHRHSITHMKRIDLAEGENLRQVLADINILDDVVYVFCGHPELEHM